MDIFSSLCEACYGLAINCSRCNDTGLQHTAPLKDACRDRLDSFSDWVDSSSPIDGIANERGDTGSPCHHRIENDSKLCKDVLASAVSSLPPSILVTPEHKGDASTYRRHTKSKAQVRLLKDWFKENSNPTGLQLSEYAKLSGLERDQVRNWFINQRRPSRRAPSKLANKSGSKQKIDTEKHHFEHMTNSNTNPIPIVRRSHRSSLTSSLKSIPDAPESMLQRWQDSPPDQEPANISAIRSAIGPESRLDLILPRQTSPQDNVSVLIRNIPPKMKMEQFVQIMLLKDIQKPRTFQYEFRDGFFTRVAFAEFASKEDAMFAVSRLDHTLLGGQTLHAHLEHPEIKLSNDLLQVSTRAGRLDTSLPFDPLALAEHFQTKKAYRGERSGSWRSAASSNGSAASSAARSYSSSISFARRKYKSTYRRSDSQDPSACHPSHNGDFLPHPQNQRSDPGDQLLWHRPSTPIPSSQPEVLESSDISGGLLLGDMEMCDEPDAISAIYNVQTTPYQHPTSGQGTDGMMSQEITKQSHACQRYRCESCTHRFNTEHEWRTHETVVHRPREEWVCSLVPCMEPTERDWNCAFCKFLFTDWELFKVHRCQPCGIAPTSPTSKPVFNTRTGLADHVKHHHDGAALTPFMVKRWRRCPTWKDGIWSCGTCGAGLQGWENRLNHLAGHFQLDIQRTKCSCLIGLCETPDDFEDMHSDNEMEISFPGSAPQM